LDLNLLNESEAKEVPYEKQSNIKQTIFSFQFSVQPFWPKCKQPTSKQREPFT
jgi:hypothetical protein